MHELPWHMLNWNIVSRLASEVGVIVAPDQANYSKSRDNVANVKIEIDLSRLASEVGSNIARFQKIEWYR